MSPRSAVRLLTLAVACSASTAAAGAAEPDTISLELDVGEQRVVPSAGVGSYSEATQGIVDVRVTPEGDAFVIVGQRPGTTSLLLLMTDGHERTYEIRVAPRAAISGGAPLEVSARDNVRLDFYFVQVDRDYHHQLGVGWPRSIGGSLSAGFDLRAGALTDANALVSDQALPQLDMAQARGWAKLMRRAAFVTANGSEARLAGGGELNVPLATGLAAALKPIVFGTEIRVLPRYDRASGRIELSIHADVSDLSGDGGTGVPGRTTSSVESVVNLELGQSVILAGLRSSSESKHRSGLPGLSELPILGGLFGSQTAREEDRELLVLIVPSVVDSVSLEARASVQQALRVFEAYAGDEGARLMKLLPNAH